MAHVLTGWVRRRLLPSEDGRVLRHANSLLIVIASVEAVSLLCQASRKPLWYDEIFTALISGMHPLARIWQALNDGMDGLPIGYYAIVQLARSVPASAETTLRLPSIVGYLACLAGIFCFTSKRASQSVALCAVLLVSLSPLPLFAVEARPYALLAGALAVAAACWQRIGERRWALPLFVVCLICAVAVHHAAVFSVAVFLLAELAGAWANGRVRVRAFAGMLLALVPFWIELPVLLHFRSIYGKGYWAKPSLTSLYGAYDSLLGMSSSVGWALVGVFCLTAGIAIWQQTTRDPRQGPEAPGGFRPEEIILAGGFLLYPPALIVVMKLAGGGYTPRYAWPVVMGFALGGALMFERLLTARGHNILLAALLLAFAIQAAWRMDQYVHAAPVEKFAETRWAQVARLTAAMPDIPVVIADPQEFLEMEYYSPAAAFRKRLLNVVDPEAALARVGYDTMERSNRIAGKICGFPVITSKEFLSSLTEHRYAYLYASHQPRTWLQRDLVAKGCRFSLVADDSHAALYLVKK